MNETDLGAPKPCNTCGVMKPLSEYHKNKSSRGGYLPKCKLCRKASDAAYVESHVHQSRLRAKEWRQDNKARADKRARDWALNNPERAKAIKSKWRGSAIGIRYETAYASHRDPEKRKSVAMRYYLANQDKYLNYGRNRRARIRGASGTHTPEDVLAILTAQRSRCACCHEKLENDYHVDHVIPLALGGSNDKMNLQILCPTCNKRKGALHPIDFAKKNGLLL